ncbi:MAG: hypothetical protein J6K97_02945 [Clostridia bacterium]|nr:hypothetical protein [Clostridia bacterium]
MDNKEKIEDKVKQYFKEGLNYIYPQLKREWLECVQKSIMGKFQGEDIEIAVEILEKMKNRYAIRDAVDGKTDLDDGLFDSVVKIVTDFSSRGIEFYVWVAGHRDSRVISGNEEKYISRLARRNYIFEKELLQNSQEENAIG